MKRLALSLLFVVLLVAQPAVAQQSGGPEIETRSAEVAVETPADLPEASQATQDGRPLYEAEAGPLELHPQNFDSGDVVDYGITESNASLAYESEFGQYRLDPGTSGTFEAFWIVSETVATDNGTDTVQVRYEALIRVANADSVTMTGASLDRLRDDAGQWREFNSTTLDELMEYDSLYAPEPQDREDLLSKMENAYKNQHNIFAQFSGNISMIVILMVTTLGGLLFLALLGIYHLTTVSSLWGRLNRFRTTEKVEGEVAERIQAVDKKERQLVLENTDIQEIPGISDREAAAFRDAIDGVSVRDAKEHLDATVLNPAALTLDRLHAMGACGYRARLTADGDGYDVDILDEDAVRGLDLDEVTDPNQLSDSDDEWLVDLASMSADMDRLILDELDEWGTGPIAEFDLVSAEFDPGAVSYNFDTLDVESLMDDLGADETRFEDPAHFGQILRELAEHVRQHPYTDGEGATDPVRATLERLLKVNGILADEHHVADAESQRQAVERALIEDDPGERVSKTIRDVKSGRGVGSD